MPDHALQPLTALGNRAARVDTFGALRITEVPDVALASLARRRDRDAALASAAAAFLGTPLPDVGRSGGAAPFTVFWTGPDQWMVAAPHASHETLAAHLKEAVGDAASVTEQTDAWVCFDVEGNSLAALFERLCPLDVARLPAGAAVRTTIEHMGCFVLCQEAGRHYRLLGPRSSAASLHHALVTMARSVGGIG